MNIAPKKLVHKNLKSSKILLDDNLHPYISSFGITRLVSKTLQNENQSLVTISPKPQKSYVALRPELWAQDSRKSADVYSFGIVLMEILSDESLENDGKALENYAHACFKDRKL